MKKKQEIRQLKFTNIELPKAEFDLIQLEKLFSRADLDHDPQVLHKLDFYLIILITEGQGFHTIDFTEYQYKSGTILTIRQDQIHKFFFSDAKGLMLLFTDSFLVSYLEKQEALKSMQLFNELLGSPKIQLKKAIFKEVTTLAEEISIEYFKTRDDYSLGIIRSQLHILVTKLYRYKSNQKLIVKDRKYLSEFLAFQTMVENNCFESKKVSDYAKNLGYSTKTLNNVVQSVVNKSAKIFIDEIVITQIKRLLINSPLTIQEIAYTAGFDEPTNLYKYFKRYVDSSPEAFRKAHK